MQELMDARLASARSLREEQTVRAELEEANRLLSSSSRPLTEDVVAALTAHTSLVQGINESVAKALRDELRSEQNKTTEMASRLTSVESELNQERARLEGALDDEKLRNDALHDECNLLYQEANEYYE